MSTRTKRLLAVVVTLVGITVLGTVLGLYLMVYVYPVWMSEKFETQDRADQPVPSRMLLIGQVSHGKQFQSPADFSRLATTYYHRSGPVGRVMEAMNWFHGPENTYAADARLSAAQVGLCATPASLPFDEARRFARGTDGCRRSRPFPARPAGRTPRRAAPCGNFGP